MKIKDGFVLSEVEMELMKARECHPDMNSTHEGYAKILEVLDELWEDIKISPRKLDIEGQMQLRKRMRQETIQVAAMAIRFVTDVISEGKK
jgi:hypothetical protein